LGFAKSKADSNLYYKVEDGNIVILLLYVDDIFVTGRDELIAVEKLSLTDCWFNEQFYEFHFSRFCIGLKLLIKIFLNNLNTQKKH